MAVFRVVSFNAPARAVLTTRETNNHHSVVIQRCGSDCVAFLPAFGLNGPRRFSRFLIQRHKASVELPDVNLSLTQSQAAAAPAAADRRDGFVEPGFIFPEGFSRLYADRENVIGTRDDINDSIANNGLRFA